jgi:hypothetical protein
MISPEKRIITVETKAIIFSALITAASTFGMVSSVGEYQETERGLNQNPCL